MIIFKETGASGTPGIGWYCVLSEAHTIATGNSAFKRGWGTVIVPAVPAGVLRDLHFSVPHHGKGEFVDVETPKQAGALFAMTGARSLIVSGRNMKAYAITTDCSKGAGDDTNYITDDAHDNVRIFIAYPPNNSSSIVRIRARDVNRAWHQCILASNPEYSIERDIQSLSARYT